MADEYLVSDPTRLELVEMIRERGRPATIPGGNAGVPPAPRQGGTATLVVQSGAADTWGYPARVQKWDSGGGLLSDLSATEVRVKEPTGAWFVAGNTIPCARFLGFNASGVACFSASPVVARWVRFTLPGALAASDANKAGCTVAYYWGGASPGSTVTVWNPPTGSGYLFSGASGKTGLATYDERSGIYWIIQMEC